MAEVGAEPLLFLAFANDRDDSASYLRNLPEEARRIQRALDAATRAGLCEVVVRQNVTAGDVLDVLLDPRYRNRIAVFHFGGHANNYQILLETTAGKTAAAAAGGLAAILAQQHGLHLVFLNGCATAPQAQGLAEAGVPVVIATDQAVDDNVATEFAGRFYQALAGGASLQAAFDDAAAAIRLVNGDVARHLYSKAAGEAPESGDRWPWALYVRPETAAATAWNLPDAAGDPLFGLPPLPQLPLPASPYRHGLDRYTREDAEIFFGRGHQIRDLYRRIIADHAAPVILLYGQSGVGKSSLLDAGLVPRVEQVATVLYTRRDPARGLLGTVQAALDAPAQAIVAEQWRALEQRLGKPLVVILDQVEELFTLPHSGEPDELPNFTAALAAIFGSTGAAPQGKLVLGFRKERLAEIESSLKAQQLEAAKVFLQPLDHAGVLEVVQGPASSERLRARYNLTVEEGLAATIAHDLTQDPASPVATVLQIVMTRMWDAAVARNQSAPHFDLALYQENLVSLDAFLDEQLKALGQAQAAALNSGFVLDLLVYHTTGLGTAQQRTAEELQQVYPHRADLHAVVQNAKDLYLLTDPAGDRADDIARTGTRLAHDTLAPLVRRDFARSDRPGQRARRILESRWLTPGGDIAAGDTLSDGDLALVERGAAGMRTWTSPEQVLVHRSRLARDRRRLWRRVGWAAAFIAIAAIVFAGAVAWWLKGVSDIERNNALTNDSRRLANLAQQQVAIDPAPGSDPVAALHLALAALPGPGGGRPQLPEAELALRRAVLSSRERKVVTSTVTSVDQIALAPGRVAVGGAGLQVFDDNLNLLETPAGADGLVQGVRWGKDGRLLAWDDQAVYIWNNGQLERRHVVDPLAGRVRCAEWQPQQQWVAICTYGPLLTWNLKSGEVITAVEDLEYEGSFTEPRSARWSPDGRWLAASGAKLVLWDSRSPGQPIQEFHTGSEQSYVGYIYWLPDSTKLVAGWPDTPSFVVWSSQDRAFAEHSLSPADTLIETPAGSGLVTGTVPAPQLLLWDVRGAEQFTLDGVRTQRVEATFGFQNVAVSPDGEHALGVGINQVDVWDARQAEPVVAIFSDPALDTIADSTWLDNHTVVALAADGTLFGFNIDAVTEPLEWFRMAGYPPQQKLAALQKLPGGRLVTATYDQSASAAQSTSLRLWQAFGAPVDQAQALSLSKGPLCDQLHRVLALPGDVSGLEALVWSDENVLVARGSNDALARWVPGTQPPALLPPPSTFEGQLVAIAPAADRLLRFVPGGDGEVWQIQFGAWQRVAPIAGPLAAAAWTDKDLVVARQDGSVVSIDIVSGGEKSLVNPGEFGAVQIISVAATRDGKTVAVKLQDQNFATRLIVWDVAAAQITGTWPIGTGLNAGGIVLHPSQPLMLSIDDGFVSLLRAGSEQPIWRSPVATPEGPGFSYVQWSPDGTRFAAGAGGHVEIWQWRAAEQKIDLLEEVDDASFLGATPAPIWSPDGNMLAVTGKDGRLFLVPVWPDDASLADQVRMSCLLTRPLSGAQAQLFVAQ